MRMRHSVLISVAAHFVLLAVMSLLIRPGEAPAAPEEMIPVRLVNLVEERPAEAPAVRFTALKAGPMPGPGRVKSRAPMGGIDPDAPRPKQAPAPPKLLTATGGEGKVPEGKVGGTGTSGEGTEPAGPTYGPGSGSGPLPVYPKNALDQNLQGVVTLTVTVSPAGKAAAIRVTGSSGHELLDQAARRAVARWTFAPAMKNGKAAEGVVTVKIRFARNAVERS
jgi:protein TonB